MTGGERGEGNENKMMQPKERGAANPKEKSNADHLHHDVCEECRVLRYLFNHFSGRILVQSATSPKLNHFELFTLNVVIYLPVLTSMLPTIVLGVSVQNIQGKSRVERERDR
jgi:hypothetical protein